MAIFARKPVLTGADADAAFMAATSEMHDAFTIDPAEPVKPVKVGILADDISYVTEKLNELYDLRDRCEQLLQETQSKLDEIYTSIAGYQSAVAIMSKTPEEVSRADGGNTIVMNHVDIQAGIADNSEMLNSIDNIAQTAIKMAKAGK